MKISLLSGRYVLPLMGLLVSGCYAGIRGSVKLVEGDQELAKARAAGAQVQAVYEWTMADEYMKKARDEWARSDFESSEKLVTKAKKWAADAETVASSAGPIEHLEDLDDPQPMLDEPETKKEKKQRETLSPPRDNERMDEDLFDEDDEGVW